MELVCDLTFSGFLQKALSHKIGNLPDLKCVTFASVYLGKRGGGSTPYDELYGKGYLFYPVVKPSRVHLI